MNLKQSILVAGNWKMNPLDLKKAKQLFLAVKNNLGRPPLKIDIIIAPPVLFITELAKLATGKKIKLAAQTVFPATLGAYTGEISMPMLQGAGVNDVIVGHSERRALGESDDDVKDRLQTAVGLGANVIVCVGEQKRDKNGNYLALIEKQIRSALAGIVASKLGPITIAYEPIWAIGTGRTATPADAHEMKIFIKKILSDRYGRGAADKVRVLYGGSVKPNNAEELLSLGQVDGFLVGGASLKAEDFLSIINTADKFSS